MEASMRSCVVSMPEISCERTMELIKETMETMRMAPESSAENSVLRALVSESSSLMSSGRNSASVRNTRNTAPSSASATADRRPQNSTHRTSWFDRRWSPTAESGRLTTPAYVRQDPSFSPVISGLRSPQRPTISGLPCRLASLFLRTVRS
jgi:hypothetical protein